MPVEVFRSLLLVVCFLTVGESWLFRRGRLILTDEKNCFCRAVNDYNYGQVIQDFGSIQRCRAFPRCGCGRAAMITCGSSCDRKVKEWVCSHNCGGGRSGVIVRASYQASVCHSNVAHDIYECGTRRNCD